MKYALCNQALVSLLFSCMFAGAWLMLQHLRRTLMATRMPCS